MPISNDKSASSSSVPVENIPTNKEITSSIDKEIHRLDKVEANPGSTYRSERILEDAKAVLQDQKAFIEEKNSGENIQKAIKDGYYLSLDLANDERLDSLFENWSDIFTSVARTGNWQDITKAVGTIASDLRDTESFILLLNELQSTIKLLLAQKVDQVTSGAETAANKLAEGAEKVSAVAVQVGDKASQAADKAGSAADKAAQKVESAADQARGLAHEKLLEGKAASSSEALGDAKYDSKLEKERKALLKQLNKTLTSLANNPTFRLLVAKAKQAGKTVQTQAVEPSADILASVSENPHAQDLFKHFQKAIQDLAGDFDVEPLFAHTKATIRFVLEDSTYFDLLEQLQLQLTAIAEKPELLDDRYTKDNLKNLSAKLQAKFKALLSHPDLLAARRESQRLQKALMNDPTSAKLVNDTRKFIRHLHSMKSGQILDPALITEMRGLIVPLLLEHLKDVPLPSVHEIKDTSLGKYEYTIDNIHINAKSLIPDNIHVKFEYELDAHPASLTSSDQHLKIILSASDIQLHIKEAEFKYERLTTPHMKDDGKVDLKTEGKGISLELEMQFNRLDETHVNTVGQTVHNKEVLNVLNTSAEVDRWSVTFSDSKHDTLYAFLSNVFSAKIKKHVEEVLVAKIAGFADTFNHKIYSLYNEAILRQEEAAGWTRAKIRDGSKAVSRLDVKAQILDSAPVSAARDFAAEKGKELLREGIAHAPEIAEAAAKYGNKALAKAGEVAVDVSEKAGELKDKATVVAGQAIDKAGDLKDKANEKAGEAIDKAGELKEKANEKAGEAIDKAAELKDKSAERPHDNVHVPNSFRDYAPLPSASFVSSDESVKSHLGDVPNTAKYPISVMQPHSVTVVEKLPTAEKK